MIKVTLQKKIFLKLNLLFKFKASILDTSVNLLFSSSIGVSELNSFLTLSLFILLSSCGLGAKKREYKIITAALNEIAAITFFESIII